MSTENNVNVQPQLTKTLNVGRAWINDRQNEEGTRPIITLRFDRDLALKLVLGANAEIALFENNKRPGTQDADYRAAIRLPAHIVDAEIERQRQVRAASAPSVAEVQAPVAESSVTRLKKASAVRQAAVATVA